ncbi:MAG: cysteine peptidase family C39 domain-containing protein, partial [Candidatus Omnitrophota bacterium]|nr:cysteine peptidase family C39 domain-containing protein [Candidatus Omnitrophota bacterium]
MLNWQEKKWVKVIAVTVVVTFLVYDIAWAMDFSPLNTPNPSAAGPGLLSKIGSFISESILHQTPKKEKLEETEISFRSQLVPTKKYEERSGFQRLEAVKNMIKRQMNEMNNRQTIEIDRQKAIYNQYQINKGTYLQNVEKNQAVQDIQNQLSKARGDTLNAAAAGGEFSYVLAKDGTKINYTDGLASSIENEPMVDSYGNKTTKTTKDMRYNNDKLLVSYDAEIVDALGNVTKIQWRNGTYSPDSVSFADATTNAGKYLLGYTETVTDPYGSTTIREWSTTREAYNSDKKATSYHEVNRDAVGNIVSQSDWYNPTYNGDNLMKYYQVTQDANGNIYNTEWNGVYNEMGRIISLTTKDEETDRDFSTKTSETTTTYEYDSEGNCVSAIGYSTMDGDDGFANTYNGKTVYNYDVINGQIKLINTASEIYYDNVDGSQSTTRSLLDYKYNDKNLMIDASGISSTEGADVFGNRFTSNAVDSYEIIYSQARRTSSVTTNDSEDIFGSITHSESETDYAYDDMGRLIDAQGYTDTTGTDVFGGVYSTHTVHEYAIINGQPKVVQSYTGGNLVNPFSDLGSMLTDLENKLEAVRKMTGAEKESFLRSIGLNGVSTVDLTSAGISTIVTWLFKATTNVINCAVLALESMMASLGAFLNVTTTKEELAQTALLVDILTGVITPESAAGKLNLSMYSMLKSTQAKGAVLKGANVTLQQIKDLGQAVIAHVGGDHYVVITKVTDTEVKYIDNSKETVASIQEFTDMWQGNILTLNLPAGATVLSDAEMMNIRGATTPPGATDTSWGSGFHRVWTDDSGRMTMELYREVSGDHRRIRLINYGGKNKDGVWEDRKTYLYLNRDGKDKDRQIEYYNEDTKEGTIKRVKMKPSSTTGGGQEIWDESENKNGKSSTHAEKIFGVKGVTWAEVWSSNTKTGAYSKARVERQDGIYSEVPHYYIDGLNYNPIGSSTGVVWVDRKVGEDVEPKNRKMSIVSMNMPPKDPGSREPPPFPSSVVITGGLNITSTSDELGFGFYKSLFFGFNAGGEFHWMGDEAGYIRQGTYLGNAGVEWTKWPTITDGSELTVQLSQYSQGSSGPVVMLGSYGYSYNSGGERKCSRGDAENSGSRIYDNSTAEARFSIEFPNGADYAMVNGEVVLRVPTGYQYHTDWHETSEATYGPPDPITGIRPYTGERDTSHDDFTVTGQDWTDYTLAKFKGLKVDTHGSVTNSINVADIIEALKLLEGADKGLLDKVDKNYTFSNEITNLKLQSKTTNVFSFDMSRNINVPGNTFEQKLGKFIKNTFNNKVYYAPSTVETTYKGKTATGVNFKTSIGSRAGEAPAGEFPDIPKHGLSGNDNIGSMSLITRNGFAFAPTGTFTQGYEPPIVIHEDTKGNISSILKSQENGHMKFYGQTSEKPGAEGKEMIFTPEAEDEKGEIRVTLAPDGKKIFTTTDRQGREIVIIMENDKAYLERGGVEIPVYFDTRMNNDGTRTYTLDLNTTIPNFARTTLSQAKNMIQKVKDMLLEKMTGAGSGKIASYIRDSILNLSGIEKVTNWLTKMGVYVINCAAKALYGLLKRAGIYISIEDLAARALVDDLLTGVVTPESTEILGTSFSALEEVSKESGWGLKSFMTTIEGLQNISNPVIAYVGGDHAVLVLGANQKEVIVVETDGKTYNVPIAEFKSEWQGLILAERAPPLKRAYVQYLSELPPPKPLSLYKSPEPNKIPLSIEIARKDFALPGQESLNMQKTIASIASLELEENAVENMETFQEPVVTGMERVYGKEDFYTSTFRLKGEGDKLLDVITGFSLDGSVTYTESWVEYQYSEDGVLIGATGGGKTWGEDVFGNSYFTTNTDTYKIIGGQAKRTQVYSVTDSTNLDGSSAHTEGNVYYYYTDGTEDPSTLDPSYLDKDGKVLVGLLKAAEGSNISTGKDIYGGDYTTNTVDSYEIMGGEAKVVYSESTTESRDIFDAEVTSTSFMKYFYTDGTESAEDLPASYFIKDGNGNIVINPDYLNAEGNIRKGLLERAEGGSTSTGKDIFGTKIDTITTNTYIIFNGKANVLNAHTVTATESLDGGFSRTDSYIDYTYSTFDNPYHDPLTGRDGIGVLINAKGHSEGEGEDIFGNKYVTTSIEEYEILGGHPKVVKADTVSTSTDFLGNVTVTTNNVENNYKFENGLYVLDTTVTATTSEGQDLFGGNWAQDSPTITTQRYSWNEQKGCYTYINEILDATGKLKTYDPFNETIPIVTQTRSTGTDIFGNTTNTTSDITYLVIKGKTVTQKVDSTTTSTDILGSATSSHTITEYSYEWKNITANGISGRFYVPTSVVTTSWQSGTDIFGGEWHT